MPNPPATKPRERTVPSPESSPGDVPPSRLARAGALGCFSAACLLAGAAISLALHGGAAEAAGALVACAVLVGAIALAGLGILLARRERGLRTQELRRTGRIERIQHELDLLGLTPKEMPIAKLILQHSSYDDIARALAIAPRTVQFHASNIYRKAYVTRRRDFERLMLAEPSERNGTPYEVIPRLTLEGEPER